MKNELNKNVQVLSPQLIHKNKEFAINYKSVYPSYYNKLTIKLKGNNNMTYTHRQGNVLQIYKTN